MKLLTRRLFRPRFVLLALVALSAVCLALVLPVLGQGGTTNEDPDDACANGLDYTKAVTPCDPQGQGTARFHPYSGNDSRIISDLTVFGSVGGSPLSLVRYANSRMAPMNTGAGVFGRDTVWTHSYQWLLRSGGTSNGQPAMRLGYPDGGDLLFVRSTTDTTKYLPPASKEGTLIQSGTTWTFAEPSGVSHVFQQRTNSSGATFYRFESFTDNMGNIYTVSYNSVTDTLPRQVTDPSGRWLRFTYSDLGTLAQTSTKLGNFLANQGVWNQISVGDNNSYRFLALFETNDYHNYPSAPIGEIEFYNKQGVKIAGTPFASDPTYVDDINNPNAHAAAMAFDGDTTSYYRYAYKRNGYIGIDAGTAVKVGSIRWFVPSGVVANTEVGQFVGLNNNSTQTPTLMEVSASDGRSVTYSYSVFNDPSGLFNWQTLTGAAYPDGANAIYSYGQQADYCRPVIIEAYDPRIQGAGTRISYTYAAGSILGFLRSEFSGMTGELIATTGSIQVHIPQTTYANGRTVTDSYLNDMGQFLSRTDSNGNKTTYTYDQSGKGFLASMKDPIGRTTSYTNSVSGARLSETKPNGTVTSYTYDAQDRMLTSTVTASGQAGRTTTYTRDANGNITRQDNPDGSFEAWTFNGFGQPLTHTLVNGATESWAYDAGGLKTSFTDAVGATTTYAYDALDLLASETDALGHTTTYTHDSLGRVTKVTYADGTFAGTDYDDFGNVLNRIDESGHVWSTTYDEFKRKVSETDPLGRTTTYSYGGVSGSGGCGSCNTGASPVLITQPNGRQIYNTYDLEWRLLTTTVAYGTSEAATTSYTYDKNGNVVTVTDPIGRTVTYAYDVLNRRTKTTFPDTKFQSVAYDGYGNVISQTNELTQISTMTYGVMNQMLSATDATGRTSSLLYETPGSAATGIATTRVMPSGKKVTTTYDALWRTVSVTVAPGTADAATSQTAYDSVGNVTSSTDPMGRVITHGYDLRNRQVLTTDALGRQWATTYSPEGLVLQTTNPDGTIESKTYDAAHRPLSSTDGGGRTTLYGYNVDNRMVTLTDPKGQVTTWGYDLTGRMTFKRYPDNNQENYTYDAARQMLTKTVPAGQMAIYTYDNRGRNTQISWSGSAAPSASTLTYDAASRPLTINNGSSNITRVYDAAGRVTSESQKIIAANRTFSVGYGYDTDGMLSTLTYPDGTVVSQIYNGRNQLASVFNGSPPPVVAYARNADNAVAALAFENGVSTLNSFDALGRLLGVSHALGGTPLGGEGYTLDAMSRRTSRTRVDGTVDGFGYDAAGQVTGATYNNNATQQSYAYDLAGNRTQSGSAGILPADFGVSPVSTSYTSNNLNQYTAINSDNPSYNANGDLLSDGTHALTWNAQSQLTQAVTGSITETYAYDALMRRVSRGDGSTLTYYVMDGWNVIAEYTALPATPTTTTLVRRYTWGDDLSGSRQGAGGVGGLLMAEEITSTTATAYFYHCDGNGNVTTITDAVGAVAAAYTYDAFGRTLSMSGPYAATNKYRFSTKPVEAGSGFYFYGERYYDPGTGRWPSRDPINEIGFRFAHQQEDQSEGSASLFHLLSKGKNPRNTNRVDVNPYLMTSNNPVMKVDKLGLFDIDFGTDITTCDGDYPKLCDVLCKVLGYNSGSCRMKVSKRCEIKIGNTADYHNWVIAHVVIDRYCICHGSSSMDGMPPGPQRTNPDDPAWQPVRDALDQFPDP